MELEEAIKILRDNIKEPIESETIPTMQSLGRVLAGPVKAVYDNPPFDRSPLDGYAVRGEDTLKASQDRPVELEVIGKVYAGGVYTGEVQRGQAVRIMTGAPIPKGADAIIRQEDTDYGEETVHIYKGVKSWSNYCYAGEDYKAGETLIKAGSLINGACASVLSSMGESRVEVYKLPPVSVIATGDEVMEPGEGLRPGKIYDSNLTYISLRLRELGIEPAFGRHAADDPELVAQIIRERSQKDSLIITTGGVSVGQKDIMHDVVKILGARQLFWKVKVKPGTPTLAFTYNNCLVICLSGNPYGAVANFELMVRPVLAKLTGNPSLEMSKTRACVQNDIKKIGGMRRFLRAYYENGKVWINGHNQSSGALSAMLDTNCLVEIPLDYELGTDVLVHLI